MNILKGRSRYFKFIIMKRNILALYLILLFLVLKAQHTFSIVAVDPVTGEVGGAGATCFATVNDIADVHPGIGFIHTQSYVNTQNQTFASSLMQQGFSPQQIMDSMALVWIDADNAPTYRQYAAVDLVGGGRTAAYTGTDCFNYKGQRLGQTYAIAGNILLGPQVLDSMEARFLNTQGSLSQKLMAALQGAKIQGADTRCIDSLVSSLSAYIIVAKPGDNASNYYIDLNVENVMPQDPIDILQTKFDNLIQGTPSEINEPVNKLKIYPNPLNERSSLIIDAGMGKINKMSLFNPYGQLVWRSEKSFSTRSINNLEKGIYIYSLIYDFDQSLNGKLIVN